MQSRLQFQVTEKKHISETWIPRVALLAGVRDTATLGCCWSAEIVGRPRRPGGSRDDLTGEHRFGDAGQATFAVLFSLFWVLDTFVVKWTTFLNESVPGWVQAIVGFALLALSGFLAVSSIRTVFGEQRDPPSVIRSGLFAHIRHPMYLSEVVLYAGLLALSISLAAAAIGVAAVTFLATLCRHEERLLIERFGDEYREYMREVPMWLPGVGRPRRR